MAVVAACSSLTLTVIIRDKLKRSLDDREAGVRFINHECDYRPTWNKTIYILKFPRNIVKDMIERFHKFNSIVPLSTSQHSDYKFAITCQCSINRETMVFFFRHPHHEMGLMNNNLSFSVDGVGLLDCRPKMEKSLCVYWCNNCKFPENFLALENCEKRWRCLQTSVHCEIGEPSTKNIKGITAKLMNN